MFDLEQSISEWRRQLSAGGIKSREVLDELESHLRDEVEQQLRSGVTAARAFEEARKRIGQAKALREEFQKVSRSTLRRKLKSAVMKFIGVPVVIPDDFSASARETLELGRQEALGFHHDFVGTEHVLLGLLGAENGMVTKVLQKMGVSREVVRTEIATIVGPGPQCVVTDSPPYTPRVRKALGLAAKEAKILKHSHIGTEHIFLGLILEGGGVAALVLNKLGVNSVRAREEIRKELRKDNDASA